MPLLHGRALLRHVAQLEPDRRQQVAVALVVEADINQALFSFQISNIILLILVKSWEICTWAYV